MIPSVVANQVYNTGAGLSIADIYAVLVGPANDGPLASPTPATRATDVKSTFGGGPLVKAALKFIKAGYKVLLVRAGATSVSAFGTVTRTDGHGTSVITVDAGSATDINAVVEVLVHTGCTVGVAGGTYQVSINGGRDFAPVAALGTANTIVVDMGDHNLTLNLGAGTLVAGELITVQANVIAAGTWATIDTTQYPGGTNTAACSSDATTYPDDNYEIVIEFLTGGALGTPGITYRWSVSNGRTQSDWSGVTALGTALSIVVPGTGGARIILGTSTQTIGAGAVIKQRTYAPNFTTQTVSDALTALFKSNLPWECATLCGTVDHSMAQTIDAMFIEAYKNRLNGEKFFVVNCRVPNAGETEAQYLTAMQTAFATRDLYHGGICYGDVKLVNADNGFLEKRPLAIAVGLALAGATPDVDIADTNRPSLGCMLADENGNPDCHDEAIYPGADDLGFITALTQPEGVYVTNPRIFAPAAVAGGVDEMIPHRWLANLHTRVAKQQLRKVLSVGIFADTKTGFIRDADAVRVESVVNAAADATLAGWISGQRITIARDDNLRTNPPTVTATGELVTKIYPKKIIFTEQVVATLSSGNG